MTMNGLGKLLGLLLAVAVVASLSCLLTSQLRTQVQPHPTDFHHWDHQQLDLTPEQDKALDAQEEAFAAKKKALGEKIQQASVELATAMREDKEYSPRVVAAVGKIHHAQSDLEMATLEHIFSMKSVLTPEQFDKLLKLTGDALSEPSNF